MEDRGLVEYSFCPETLSGEAVVVEAVGVPPQCCEKLGKGFEREVNAQLPSCPGGFMFTVST